MAARLLACKRVLKETGSIYLHCDPTAGHYLKLLMDAVFGSKNFLNEIIWAYRKWTNASKHFQNNHDTILVYVRKRGDHKFNKQFDPDAPQKAKYERGWDTNVVAGGIRQIIVYDRNKAAAKLSDPSYDRVVYREGQTKVALPDHWNIPILNSQAHERLGYPTQKPLALLERIIRASSNEGDLVLDPFCGCGTAVEAAQNLGRRWLGIDVEPLAVDLMARRLRDRCGVDPQIRGIPYDFEQAQRLAANAPYEFERWAIRLIPGAQPNFKQSGDGGLDGRAVVASEARPQPLFGFQVKGGQSVGRPVLDAFHGALTMNGCAAGLLVVLEERIAYRLRGHLGAQERVQLNGWNGPRIGVWSVEDWLEGRRGAPVPPLVGAGETLELLRPQAWQRRLGRRRELAPG